MNPADLQARIGPQDQAGLAGSAGLGHHGIRAAGAAGARSAAQRGVTSALDNTWGAGLAFNGFDLGARRAAGSGADIVVQALTKYPSGGGDVLMGSIVTRDDELHLQLKLTPHAPGLGHRRQRCRGGAALLPSLPLRYRAQDAAARALAALAAGRGRKSRSCCTRPSTARRGTSTGRRCAAAMAAARPPAGRRRAVLGGVRRRATAWPRSTPSATR